MNRTLCPKGETWYCEAYLLSLLVGILETETLAQQFKESQATNSAPVSRENPRGSRNLN